MSYLVKSKISYLPIGKTSFKGYETNLLNYVKDNECKVKQTWDDIIHVFVTHEDDTYIDNRSKKQRFDWRGEFFGKLMRGSCLVYQATKDEELYNLLDYAARKMLDTQDELGRFSTYSLEFEFNGWDIWCRKYVLTGFQHFYDICKDEKLKERIILALCKHLDYIISKVGEGDGKIGILQASNSWQGLNSATLLEPVVRMYELTGKKEYLDYAKYIISTGGCLGGNLLDFALSDKLPYQFPVSKAYELTSFFEGLLAYYQATNDKKYLEIVEKYVDKVMKEEMSVIGCAGNDCENFDHSRLTQTESYSKKEYVAQEIGQETCVTVTIIRILSRLYQITGDDKYIKQIEISSQNALFGTINKNHQHQHELWDDFFIDGFPIDSYSPLFDQQRGRGIGGYLQFKDGGHFGCCVSIAPAAFALYSLNAVVLNEDKVIINYPLNGEVELDNCKLVINSKYPEKYEYSVKIETEKPIHLKLNMLIPTYLDTIKVVFKCKSITNSDGCLEIDETFENGDVIDVIGTFGFSSETINNKVCLKYGPIVLALDPIYDNERHQLTEELSLHSIKLVKPKDDERFRFEAKDKDNKDIVFVDYASAGKRWDNKPNHINVWLNIK